MPTRVSSYSIHTLGNIIKSPLKKIITWNLPISMLSTRFMTRLTNQTTYHFTGNMYDSGRIQVFREKFYCTFFSLSVQRSTCVHQNRLVKNTSSIAKKRAIKSETRNQMNRWMEWIFSNKSRFGTHQTHAIGKFLICKVVMLQSVLRFLGYWYTGGTWW